VARASTRVGLAARRRRRLGYGLLGFGVTGLVLVIAAAVLLLGSLGSINGAASGFESQRAELVSMLDPAATALSDAGESAANAGGSLTKASDASRRAADLTSRLATSFDALAALGDVDILGSRPFAGMSSQFTEVAGQSRSLSTDLGSTADALSTNVADSQRVAADLRSLAQRLRELEGSLQSTAGPGGSLTVPVAAAEVVLLALLGWLSVPAVASLWLGRRLLRRVDRPVVRRAP
jgi:hypothetical protein